ncbi:MAG: type 1 glutamine amidotransferase [Chloroflexota bacterium]|nr:type 1 glutamine amidotransferase [Chloroflexota bacterium]
MRRVLALQHTWDDPPGHLDEILHEYGIDCHVVEVEKEPVPALEPYAACIVLGGPQHANADDMHPYLVPEKALIRAAIKQDIPYLGICLGGQLLAHAAGGQVTRHHLAEIGFYRVELTAEGQADPLFAGLPGYQQVIHWHMDVFSIPTGAIQLATSEHTPNQAFRFGRRAYGLQYHIELTPAMLDTWLRYPAYKQEIIEVSGLDTPEVIEQQRAELYPVYRAHTRTLFENFLKIAELI